MKKISIRNITISGFLIALNIVLSRFITIPGIINFGGFPIIFAGIVLGPVIGGIVGAVGDIVSFIIKPTGSFMPHFVLTSALTGIIPGILMNIPKADVHKFSFWRIFLCIFVGQVTTSVLMVPYFRNILFGHPLSITMTKAAIKQAVNIPVYSILIKVLAESLTKAGVIEK